MRFLICLAVLSALNTSGWAANQPAGRKDTPAIPAQKILTPKPGPEPRINGPGVFGVRPGHPFLYRIPATGERPMAFDVEGLPAGLMIDAATGQMTGTLEQAGEYKVVLKAKNRRGESRKKFRIVVGEKIALTPPMTWNSWYCFTLKVSQEKVLRAARAMVTSGLIDHGWTYIHVDGGWAGQRTGKDHALQPNERFPDMKAMCNEIHRLGLKAGIYSTPWIGDYAGDTGGSSDRPDGAWNKQVDRDPKNPAKYKRLGKYSFAKADARQWAEWGFDYMKYDWFPNDLPHVIAMSKELRSCGRDIVYSLSNRAPFEHAAELAKWANLWRTSGDLGDAWENGQLWVPFGYCVSDVAFSQDRWAPFAGPGHWIDPDVMQLGVMGMDKPQPSRLTPDEQYSVVSMWCLLSAPLAIGGDLTKMDEFTLNLLTNDEVLAIDQDMLGIQATRTAVDGPVDIYKKPLEDGSVALGMFNRSPAAHVVKFNKWIDLVPKGKYHMRDLWRQKDLPDVIVRDVEELTAMADRFVTTLPPHGVLLVKLTRGR